MEKPARVERVSSLLFYGFVLLLTGLVFLIFRPFLVPLGWAVVLAVLSSPATRRLKARWGPTRAAAVGTAAVTLILIVPALLLMVLFVLEGAQVARDLQATVAASHFDWVNRAWSWLTAWIGEAGSDLPTLIQESAGRIGTFLAAQLGGVLRNIALFLFELFVILFALFYFIRDGDAIMEGLRRALPFEEAIRDQILDGARVLIHVSVRVGLFIAAIQGLLGGVAFAAVGIDSAVFWGIVMGFVSLLPVVGAWLVWLPAAVWLLATREVVQGVVLLAIGAGIIGTVDNILRPALMSGRARLNGLLIFVSVLGGIAAFGVLGVVLGPIVTATAMAILEVYTRREETPA